MRLNKLELNQLYLLVLNDMQDKYLNSKNTNYFKDTKMTYKVLVNLINLSESQNDLPVSYIIDSIFSYYSKTKRNKNKLKPLTLGYITNDFISKAVYYHKRYDKDYNFNLLTYKYRTLLSNIIDIIAFKDLDTLKDYKNYLSIEYLRNYKNLDNTKFTNEELEDAWKDLLKLDGFLSLPSYYLIIDNYVYHTFINNFSNNKLINTAKYISFLLGNSSHINVLLNNKNNSIPDIFKNLNLDNLKSAREILLKAGFIFEN